MGYIAHIKRFDKKNKRIKLGDKVFKYHFVVPYAEKLPVGTEVSYSNAGDNLTFIARATPEYKRIAKELREKYAKRGEAIPAQMRVRIVNLKEMKKMMGVKKNAKR